MGRKRLDYVCERIQTRIPEKEMRALDRLARDCGKSRTQLLRDALALIFKENCMNVEMVEMQKRQSTIPVKENRVAYRHVREFMEMSLSELMER